MDVKHFVWTNRDGESGRIAVKTTASRFELRQLAGSAPRPEVLFAVLEQMPETVEAANELHESRQDPWRVDVRVGMSGCRDYLLRHLRSKQLRDLPIGSGLHISMYGKLNDDVNIWLRDLTPLLITMLEHGEGEGESRGDIEEVPLPSLEGLEWREPHLELDILSNGIGVVPTRAALLEHRRRLP
jgi:hypothetical protein